MNVLNEQYASQILVHHVACVQKMAGLGLFDWQSRVLIVMSVVFFEGRTASANFFLRSNLSLRVSSKQWDCNGDDWFSAGVSGQPAICQNENQYKVSPTLLAPLAKKKKGHEVIPFFFRKCSYMFQRTDCLHERTFTSYCYRLILSMHTLVCPKI